MHITDEITQISSRFAMDNAGGTKMFTLFVRYAVFINYALFFSCFSRFLSEETQSRLFSLDKSFNIFWPENKILISIEIISKSLASMDLNHSIEWVC